MKVIDLLQEGDEWLNWRKQGVTATDAVILSGRSPYKTKWRLWAEKVNFARPVDLSLNPLVRKGKENEPRARKAAEQHFNDLLLPMCVESSLDSLIRVSLDGLNNQKQPVELKCPSKAVWDEVCTLGTASAAYQMYEVQVQYQMLAVGSEVGYLVFWFNEEIRVFQIQANKPFLVDLYQEVKRFWALCEARVEPQKDLQKDLYIPVGEDAAQWIEEAKVYKAYAIQIEQHKLMLKELQERQTASLDAMKAMMGEYYLADYCGVMVTRYQVQGKIDYAAALSGNGGLPKPDDLEKYRSPTSERWRVTVSDSVLPRTIIEDSVLAPLEHADESPDLMFF